KNKNSSDNVKENCVEEHFDGVTVNVEYVSGEHTSSGSSGKSGEEKGHIEATDVLVAGQTPCVIRIKTIVDDDGMEINDDSIVDDSNNKESLSVTKKRERKRKKSKQHKTIDTEVVEMSKRPADQCA